MRQYERPSPGREIRGTGGGTASSLDGQAAEELRDALARHLLEGRPTADLAQLLLASVTVFVLGNVLAPWMGWTWLAAFVGTAAARAANRRSAVVGLDDAPRLLAFLRRDVWLGAGLWGAWAALNVGVPPKELAYLLLIFAGLVAAGSTTLVADRRAFLGFVALLIGPLTAAVALSGLTRDHLVLLLLIALYTPVMILVHERAHHSLVERLLAGTRLRLAEEATARQRDFLNALILSAPSPIVVLDMIGHITHANPAFERALGRERSDVLDTRLQDLAKDGEDRLRVAAFLDQVHPGATAVAELPFVRGDATPIWMRFSGTIAGEGEGSPLLMGEDVTQQVEAREALDRARLHAEQADRSKSAFLARMSHEIRTPLNGILGMIEILLDSTLTPAQAQAAEVIRSSGQGLMRILNDVLDTSKIEAGQMDLVIADFDVAALIREVARVFSQPAAHRGNVLSVEVDPAIPLVLRGDADRIRQVLSNLVGNAVKFTENGRIVLAVRDLGLEAGHHRIRFMVRDTGIGIPLSKQQMIFEEFEQADSSTTRTYGGTGLGLSISKRLVELMGGHIDLTSEAGLGSEFSWTLLLPLGEASATQGFTAPAGLPGAQGPRAEEPEAAAPRPGVRILLAEDNPVNQQVALTLLRKRGHEVVCVADGVQAVAAAEREFFDLVLMDIEMPEMDGIEATRRIRALHPTLPIVALTAHAFSKERERCQLAGMNDFLSKPFRPDDLYGVVERWSPSETKGAGAPKDTGAVGP